MNLIIYIVGAKKLIVMSADVIGKPFDIGNRWRVRERSDGTVKRTEKQHEWRERRVWRRHELHKRIDDLSLQSNEKFDQLYGRLSVMLNELGVPKVKRTKALPP